MDGPGGHSGSLGGHEIGGASHSAGMNHGISHGTGHGAFGRSSNAFGHPFDLGHMAATLGGHGSGHSSGHHASVGHAPGAVHGQSFWAFGFIGQALAHMGALDPATGNTQTKGTEVRLPGVVFGENCVQLLVWPHGNINTQMLFRRIATRYGLVTLSKRAHGIMANCKDKDGILDTKQFDGPGNNARPSGSFNGAEGRTTVWNEVWQLPRKKHFWSSSDADLRSPLPPHIVVTGYTWYYSQTGDYETRIAITIANPLTCVATEWVPIDLESAVRHMAKAQKIALDIFNELTKVKPKEYSLIMRKIQAQASLAASLAAEILPCQDENDSCSPADRNNGPGPGPVPMSVRTSSNEVIINSEMQGSS